MDILIIQGWYANNARTIAKKALGVNVRIYQLSDGAMAYVIINR